jgi:hypothetical protein
MQRLRLDAQNRTYLQDVGGDAMQIRSKAYLRFAGLCRSLRERIRPLETGQDAETSPSLIFVAVVLTMFLAIFEADAHRTELHSMGLASQDYDEAFLGP